MQIVMYVLSNVKQCMSKAGDGGPDLTFVTSIFTAVNWKHKCTKGNTQNKQAKTDSQ